MSDTIKDSLGRVLTFKTLSLLEEMDLWEAAGGQNAENRRWMLLATFASCVRQIDDVPCIFPTTRQAVRAQVKKVGEEGMDAIRVWVTEDPALAPLADEAAAGNA